MSDLRSPDKVQRSAVLYMKRTKENLHEERDFRLEWIPPVKLVRLPGETDPALALRVLSAAAVFDVLELRQGIDGFAFERSTVSTVTLSQRFFLAGRSLAVLERQFTVSLGDGPVLTEIHARYRAHVPVPTGEILKETTARRVAGVPPPARGEPPAELAVQDGRLVYVFPAIGTCAKGFVDAKTAELTRVTTCYQ